MANALRPGTSPPDGSNHTASNHSVPNSETTPAAKARARILMVDDNRANLVAPEAVLLREREREALEKRAEQRIRMLVDAMPLCVWAADAKGNAFYCNAIWSEFSGLDTEESRRFGIAAAPPEDVERVELAIEDAFR